MSKVEAEAESINLAYEADRIRAAERAADDELNAGIEDLAVHEEPAVFKPGPFHPKPGAADESALATAVHEELADSIPTLTTRITGDTLALERVLAKRRDEKRELQKLLSVTKAKLRQTTATIKGIEDHLDTLFECEG